MRLAQGAKIIFETRWPLDDFMVRATIQNIEIFFHLKVINVPFKFCFYFGEA